MVEKKESEKRVNTLRLAVCVGVALIVALAVFLILSLNNKKTGEEVAQNAINYQELREQVQTFANDRAKIEEFLDTKVGAAKLSDKEKKAVAAFEKAAAKNDTVQRLKTTEAYGDEAVKKIVDETAALYENIQTLYLVEQDVSVMFDGVVSDDDLAQLSKSKNDYLKTLANSLTEYRKKVKKLSVKDANFNKIYKSLVEEGKEIKEKYAKIEIEDLVGMTREKILSFYDKLDELNNYLAEQI